MYVAEIFERIQRRSIRAQYLSRAAQDPARYDSLRHVHAEPEVRPSFRETTQEARAIVSTLVRTGTFVVVP
jgi:hypothetical protein